MICLCVFWGPSTHRAASTRCHCLFSFIWILQTVFLCHENNVFETLLKEQIHISAAASFIVEKMLSGTKIKILSLLLNVLCFADYYLKGRTVTTWRNIYIIFSITNYIFSISREKKSHVQNLGYFFKNILFIDKLTKMINYNCNTPNTANYV